MWESHVGERIAKLRKDRKLSRAQFGELIGVSTQYVGRIERGAHSLASSVITKICIVTGVSSDYIIFGSTDPTAVATVLSGFSNEQIQITLEIAMKVAQFLNTENGNNLLIQEVMSRQHSTSA